MPLRLSPLRRAGLRAPVSAGRLAGRVAVPAASCGSRVQRPVGRLQQQPWARAFSSNASVTAGDRTVRVASADAPARRTELPNIWLRDNCRCAQCVNQDTSQRNFDTFAIPEDIHAVDVRADDTGLHVVWSGDNHKSHYPWRFIQFYQNHDHRSPEPVDFHYWGQSIAANPPSVGYEAVMDTSSDAGIGKLTDLIRTYGFAFVHNTPFADPDDTKRLLERIAFIRVTHYGGFYDFIPDLAMADTAYTNLPLPAHTDTTYFTEPAGLQAFHMLSHEPAPGTGTGTETGRGDGDLGGASLLVDAFHAARLLEAENPDAFDVLTRVRLPWHASGNQGITIAPNRRYPVLELVDGADNEVRGRGGGNPGAARLHRVRWNNDDRGIVPFGGPDADGIDPARWYAAARAWTSILRRPDVEYWTKLEPGKVLIFDNWRVMHGRSAFVGVRRMCGAYTARDDFISRWRNTNFPREQVLEQVVG